MKKITVLCITVIALFAVLIIPSFAANTQAEVYISISDAQGKLVMVQEKITVTDTDSDGKITLNDALYAAHEAKYEGGAAAGYASSEGQYGLKIDKLWGTDNGGSYGYCVNNVSAMGLGEEVNTGDMINAYVYTDLTAWSDTYCYFDAYKKASKPGEEISLNLSYAGFDESWNPITAPVSGAKILIDGKETSYATDKDGNVKISLQNDGKYIISAVSDTQTLVPPSCIITVAAGTVPTGDTSVLENTLMWFAVCISAASLFVIIKSKKAYENIC